MATNDCLLPEHLTRGPSVLGSASDADQQWLDDEVDENAVAALPYPRGNRGCCVEVGDQWGPCEPKDVAYVKHSIPAQLDVLRPQHRLCDKRGKLRDAGQECVRNPVVAVQEVVPIREVSHLDQVQVLWGT